MCARKQRDPETEEFLKRVEEYDSKQRGSVKEKPQLKGKPEFLSSRFTQEDTDHARRLLNDDSSSFNYEQGVEEVLISNKDLAYKSAYNYEKTFSPTKPKYNKSDLGFEVDEISNYDTTPSSNRTYAISEEDYFLLQKLKLDLNSSTNEVARESRLKLPSRGRPRNDLNHAKLSSRVTLNGPNLRSGIDEEEPPSLPVRKYLNKPSVTLEENPPWLPTRRSNKQVLKDGNTDDSRNFKTLTNRHVNDVKRDNAATKAKKVAPPPVPRKWQNTKPAKVDDTLVKSKLEQDTFLSSIEKNKLTDYTSPHESGTLKYGDTDIPKTPKKTNLSHLNFLDSMQKKDISPSLAETSMTKHANTSPIVTNRESKPDSFINSALKNMEIDPGSPNPKQAPIPKPKPRVSLSANTHFVLKSEEHHGIETTPTVTTKPKPTIPPKPSLSTKLPLSTKPSLPAKPSLPVKPSVLQANTKKINDSPEKHAFPHQEIEFANVKLRITPKEKPIIPPKRISQATIKLKPVQVSASLNGSPQKSKPRIEPLVKLNKVQPESPGIKTDVPEALEKLRSLSKTKHAPPIPSRKISMPEALKKAEFLRQHTKNIDQLPKNDNSFKNELDAVFASSRSISTLSSGSSFANDNKDIKYSPPTPVSDNDCSRTSDSLKHVTKTRAKGPRRKLPTGVI